MSTVQRWTLAVVCAATAILMLDIAVVNTALPPIAARAAHRPRRAAVGRRRLHARARHRRADRRLAGRPLRPPARLRRRPGRRSRSRRPCAPRPARSRCSTPPARSRASARRSCSPPRWRCSPTRSRTQPSGRGALAAYGATIGASFAVGPPVGGALTTGLGWRWVFLVNVPIGDRRAVRSRCARCASRATRTPAPVDFPGLRHAHRRPVPARARAAARQRGRLGQHADRRRAGRRRRAAGRVRGDRGARRKSPMLPLGLFRSGAFTGAQLTAFAISGSFFAIFLYATLYLQNVLGLSRDRGGSRLHAGHARDVRGVRRDRAARPRSVHPGVLISGGLRAGRRRDGAADRRAGRDSSWTVLLPGIDRSR